MLEPRKFVAGSAQGMLSPTGRCHAFDVAADGFVSGEGCAVVLLKRLPDALRDGDRILAVVRGTAANQDGHTVNIATPSAARADRGVPGGVGRGGRGRPHASAWSRRTAPAPRSVTRSNTPAWPRFTASTAPARSASVKTNFGHTQSAAGALGLMKAILALQHGVVPQNLHFTRLPDELAQIDTKLFVPQEITPWPHERSPAPTGGGVVVRAVGNQRARHPGAGSRDRRSRAPRRISRIGRRRHRCCSRCRPPRPTNCAAPPAGWPTGCRHTTTWRCRIWPTPWRVGVRTARCAPPSSPSSRPELTEALREVADGDTPYQAAVGQRRPGSGVGVLRAGFAVGRRWALTCWRPNRCSPPPSRRSSR